MVVILEALLAVGVGRDIVNRHKSVIEKSKAPHLHRRVFKRKTRQSQKSYAFMKDVDEDWKPLKKLWRKSGSSSTTRTWHALVSSHITLTAVKNEALKGAHNRSLEDKTIQLWKHKLIYYKNSVVFSDGEIDLRDVVKIQMHGSMKIALIMEIEDTKISKQPKALNFSSDIKNAEDVPQVKEKIIEKEGRRKDMVRRAWVLDFSANPSVAKEWLSGISANWKYAQQVHAVKISPVERVFPKSVRAKELMKMTKTGDIVLFKSKHPSGLIIRSWTGGD